MSSNDDLIKRIKDDISKSGYPLEIEIYKLLKDFNWMIMPQYYYKDRITNKEKSIDFICRKSVLIDNKYFYSVFIYLFIECKKLEDKQWVLFTISRDSFDEENFIIENLQFSYKRDKKMKITKRDELVTSLFSISHLNSNIPRAINHYVPFNKNDSFYKAINQNINALIFKKDSIDNTLEEYNIKQLNNLFIFYPIIICDKNLYEYKVHTEELSKKDHILFLTKGIGNEFSSYAIDVITSDIFSDYLHQIDTQLDSIFNVFLE